MTPRAGPLAALALAACPPIVYDIDEAGDLGGPSMSTGPGPETDPTDPSGPPPPTLPDECFDGAQDGAEPDVDCGGPCPPCQGGQACFGPDDCASGFCQDGTCIDAACTSDDDCWFVVDGQPCLLGSCDPAGFCLPVPAFEGEPCDDLDLCTDFTTCAQGQCQGQPRTCDHLTGACGTGFCNPASGNCAIEPAPDGTWCGGEPGCAYQCASGQCTAPPTAPIVLQEPFTMPGAWEFEPPWQVGPAVGSMCAGPGAEDPESDHTADGQGDNMLAGTAIGDCLPPDVFPPACMTSPPIMRQVDPGTPLELRYYSWLSLGGPPTTARVEAFDGMSWSTLEEFPRFILEKDWILHAIPLDKFTGPLLQVRFCVEQPAPGMPVGGWSVDDVEIGPPLCAAP